MSVSDIYNHSAACLLRAMSAPLFLGGAITSLRGSGDVDVHRHIRLISVYTGARTAHGITSLTRVHVLATRMFEARPFCIKWRRRLCILRKWSAMERAERATDAESAVLAPTDNHKSETRRDGLRHFAFCAASTGLSSPT